MGRAHEDYYDVDAVTGGRRVAGAVGRAAFAAWEGADRLELPSLTPDRLLDEAMKSVKK